MSKDKARSWLQTSQVYSDFPVNLFELDLTPNFLCPLWLTVLQNAMYSDDNEMNPTEYSHVFWKVDENYKE